MAAMDNKKGDWVVWYSLGCLMGFAITALFVTALAAFSGFHGFWKLLFDYQTLITGILAILAAGLSVGLMQHQTAAMYMQIQQTERFENERRERRDYAVRSVLPHTLRTIGDYAEDCIGVLVALDKVMSSKKEEQIVLEHVILARVTPLPTENSIPYLSNEAIITLRDNIEGIQNDQVRTKMRELIGKLQIQNSRFRASVLNVIDHPPNYHRMGDHYWDAIEIYALTAHLFPYAHFDSGYAPAPLNEGDYVSAAANCTWNKFPEHHERVKAMVQNKWRLVHGEAVE